MDFETLTFDVDGVRTVVKAIGKGPAVLALHGAATLEGYEWAGGLANRFRVYLPFHPGFGESDAAPHVVGMQDMIVHNLRLLSALRLDKPHLVGHSMGGWMAAEMAIFAGDLFGRLVLNAPAGLNHPDHPATDLSSDRPTGLAGLSRASRRRSAALFPGRLRRARAGRICRRTREGGRRAHQHPQGSWLWSSEPRPLVEPHTERNAHRMG